MCSAVFQSEDRDREDPRSEGAVAGWAAGVPHWTGSPPGGALSCAKHQQDAQQWESNFSLLLDLCCSFGGLFSFSAFTIRSFLFFLSWEILKSNKQGFHVTVISVFVRQLWTSSVWNYGARWSACALRSTPARLCSETSLSSPSHCR